MDSTVKVDLVGIMSINHCSSSPVSCAAGCKAERQAFVHSLIRKIMHSIPPTVANLCTF